MCLGTFFGSFGSSSDEFLSRLARIAKYHKKEGGKKIGICEREELVINQKKL